METHYYLSVSPIEALISSQLDPYQFGSYMATGAKNGSYERIMFIEVEGGFGDFFDWAYAKERTVTHSDGSPKHSVWLSVYRVLEHVPFEVMKSMYLTTPDGRTLELPPSKAGPNTEDRKFWVYQELCPITPLVVSALNPIDFSAYMTDPNNHVQVPQVIFADFKVVDFDNPEKTGNIGAAYDRNLGHLRECVDAVTSTPDKPNKNVERSVNSFSYQIIDRGIYVGTGDSVRVYPMPTIDEIRQHHYDWGRSAMIL